MTRAIRREKQGVKEGWRRVLRRKEAGWKGGRESRVKRRGKQGGKEGQSRVQKKDGEGWLGVRSRVEGKN